MRCSSLTAAATLFWVSWLLMPGVGVTAAGQIFDLVSSQRSLVLASVILQLGSAALYVPGLVGAGVEVARREGPRVHLRFDPERLSPAELISRLAVRYPVRDLFVQDPPIEEIIARMYAAQGAGTPPSEPER